MKVFELRSGNLVQMVTGTEFFVQRLIVTNSRGEIVTALMGDIAQKFFDRNSKGKEILEFPDSDFNDTCPIAPEILELLKQKSRRMFEALTLHRHLEINDSMMSGHSYSSAGGTVNACSSRHNYYDFAGIGECKFRIEKKWTALYLVLQNIYQNTWKQAKEVWDSGLDSKRGGHHQIATYFLALIRQS